MNYHTDDKQDFIDDYNNIVCSIQDLLTDLIDKDLKEDLNNYLTEFINSYHLTKEEYEDDLIKLANQEHARLLKNYWNSQL